MEYSELGWHSKTMIYCPESTKFDFFRAIGKFFKKTYIKFRKIHEIFICIDSPYNLMFEDYFMQMLSATALQMVHPFSTILAYSFQHFGRYLTNKCFNVVCQGVN